VTKRKPRTPPPRATPALLPRRMRAAALLAAVFTLKLVVLLQLQDHPLLQPDAGFDTSVYVKLAREVVAGNVALGPGLFVLSPLYIYFVAAIIALTSGSLMFVRIVQIVLGTVTVWLIFRTADGWHGRRAAWMSSALATFTGLFTFYEVLLLQAALDPILTASALACLAFALTSGSRRWYVASGVALGALALNRPNVLLAVAGIVPVLLVARRRSGALRIAVGVAIVLLPIIVRNYVVARDLSPVSSHGGLSFYIGNNREADGSYHTVDGITPSIAGQQQDGRRVAEAAVGRRLDDSEVSAYFYGRGWAWITQQPRAAAVLFLRKLAYTFNAGFLPLNYSYPYYASDERTLLRFLPVGPWLLIPLGLLGIWLAAPADQDRRRAFWIWASFVPLYAAAVAVFFVTTAHRLPLLVALCVTAGGAVDALSRLISIRPIATRPLAAAALALVGLGVVANWPTRLDDGRSEEQIRMALALIDRERYPDAESRVADIARTYTPLGSLHLRIGQALLQKRQTGSAVRHLEQASTLDPNRPEIDYAYGRALVEAGRPKEAVPHLRRAFEAGVRVDRSGLDLARALAMIRDRAGAIRILQKLRPARGDDAAAWFAQGQLAMDVDAPRLAEAFFRQTLQVKPDDATAHQQLGLALANQGRFEEALHSLQESARLNPSDATTRLNVAVALAELGRVPEARAQAEEALRLRPGYDRAQKFLSVLPR
jgi:tetratricopeptide (TPR) repeat protein